MTSFTGKDEILTFNLIALKAALRAYARHGMQMNRRLTPTRMLALAAEATGKKYKRGQQAQAAEDIEKLLEERKNEDAST